LARDREDSHHCIRFVLLTPQRRFLPSVADLKKIVLCGAFDVLNAENMTAILPAKSAFFTMR